MQVTIHHLDNVGFTAEARGHTVICDQPQSNRGQDRGMTPPEFLLASLGTCAAYYALEYLRTRGLPTEGLRVQVDAEKATGPARLAKFAVEVTVPALEERHQQGIERAVKSCLVHHTLLGTPEIDVRLQQRVLEPVAG